jgi:hypothetical protein
MTVVGPDADVRAFVDKARAPHPLPGPDSNPHIAKMEEKSRERMREKVEPLCFHTLVPLPDDYTTRPYDDGHGDDYGYRVEKAAWGVKWGAYEQKEPVVEDGRATYEFTCAWGVPDRFLVGASRLWPTLTFLVSWGGEGPTRGRLKAVAGVLLPVIDDRYEDTKHLYPVLPDGADAAAQQAWNEAYEAVEHEYVRSHDAWVAVDRRNGR